MGSTWEKYLRAGILWDSDLVYLQLTLYTYSILLSSNCIVVKHRGQGLRMRTSTVHKIRICKCSAICPSKQHFGWPLVKIGRTHKFFSHVISKDNESFDYEKLYKQKSFKKILYT